MSDERRTYHATLREGQSIVIDGDIVVTARRDLYDPKRLVIEVTSPPTIPIKLVKTALDRSSPVPR